MIILSSIILELIEYCGIRSLFDSTFLTKRDGLLHRIVTMNKFLFVSFLLLLTQSLVAVIRAERILVLAPICIQSHKISFMPFVEALAERGHQVTVVTPYPPKKKIENVREIVMVDFLGQLQYNWFEMSRRNPIEALVSIVRDLRLVGTVGYKNLMENKEIRQLVDSREVDLLIIDAVLNDFT